jgi:hypothetical protein
MQTTRELLHLGKLNLEHQKIMDIPTSFKWLVLFDEAFKCGDGAKFWDYVGTNVEPLCMEFCKSVQCHVF